MGMPEPVDPWGFWATVKDLSIDTLWPPDDEDVVALLATALRGAGRGLEVDTYYIDVWFHRTTGSWPDGVGELFRSRAPEVGGAYREQSPALDAVAAFMEAYRKQIIDAKNAIRAELETNLALFVLFSFTPGLQGSALALAAGVALKLGRLIQAMAAAISRIPLVTKAASAAARALPAVAKGGVKVGGGAVDEAIIDIRNQQRNVADGIQDDVNLGRTGQAMKAGALGEAIGEGLGKLAEPITNAARRGLNATGAPRWVQKVGEHTTTAVSSAANNGISSPTANYLIQNEQAIAKGDFGKLSWEGYGNALREQGLAAASMAPLRSNTELAAHDINNMIYGGGNPPDGPPPAPASPPSSAGGEQSGAQPGAGELAGDQTAGRPDATSGLAPGAAGNPGTENGTSPGAAPGTGAGANPSAGDNPSAGGPGTAPAADAGTGTGSGSGAAPSDGSGQAPAGGAGHPDASAGADPGTGPAQPDGAADTTQTGTDTSTGTGSETGQDPAQTGGDQVGEQAGNPADSAPDSADSAPDSGDQDTGQTGPENGHTGAPAHTTSSNATPAAENPAAPAAGTDVTTSNQPDATATNAGPAVAPAGVAPVVAAGGHAAGVPTVTRADGGKTSAGQENQTGQDLSATNDAAQSDARSAVTETTAETTEEETTSAAPELAANNEADNDAAPQPSGPGTENGTGNVPPVVVASGGALAAAAATAAEPSQEPGAPARRSPQHTRVNGSRTDQSAPPSRPAGRGESRARSLVRRATLRGHMRPTDGEPGGRPAQPTEETGGTRAPNRARAAFRSFLHQQKDGLPSHGWFLGTALLTHSLPGWGVALVVGTVGLNPVLGGVIAAGALAVGVGNGLAGRWFANLAQEAGRLKADQARQAAERAAQRVDGLFDPDAAAPADQPAVTPSWRTLVGEWVAEHTIVGTKPFLKKVTRIDAAEPAEADAQGRPHFQPEPVFIAQVVIDLNAVLARLDAIDGVESPPPAAPTSLDEAFGVKALADVIGRLQGREASLAAALGIDRGAVGAVVDAVVDQRFLANETSIAERRARGELTTHQASRLEHRNAHAKRMVERTLRNTRIKRVVQRMLPTVRNTSAPEAEQSATNDTPPTDTDETDETDETGSDEAAPSPVEEDVDSTDGREAGRSDSGAAGRMRGFGARPELGREPRTEVLATEEALGKDLAEAAGLVGTRPDPDHPGFLRADRTADGTDGFLFTLKAGRTDDGNPAEFTLDDKGVATIVVSESLLPSTSRWMWRVVLRRAIGHELSEINQKLLGNDRPDVLVDAQPGAATGASAHEHGRQTEMRVLEHAHESARGPLRVARRMALRRHMRLLAEEMRVHPTQKHSQQLKRLLSKDVEEIVDKHFPIGSRASWHRRLHPDPEADGHPSHAWFVGTALVTGGLPGLGVGATIGALANPGLGLAIGVSSLVTALANGLVGRWYAVKQSEAGDELKDYQAKELARQDALLAKELYDRLLATMLGTTFVPPEEAPQEPEVRGPEPTGVPKWQYRLAARLPSLLGTAAAIPFLWAGPFPDPQAPPGSGATVQFSLRSLIGFGLAGLAVAGGGTFLEKFTRRRQVADELAQVERSLASFADNKRDFLIAFLAQLHQIMRWIDTIDRVKSQPPQLDAPPPPPARDHGGGPKLLHFGGSTAPGAGDQILKALADTLPDVVSPEALTTIVLGLARSTANWIVNTVMDRGHHVSEVRLIDRLVDFELEIEHAHSQQEQADLLRKLVEQILPEIHEAVKKRYGTPIPAVPADPNKPVGSSVRRQRLADERAASATRQLTTRAAYAEQAAQRARRYADHARDAAEQAGLRPDTGPDAQGRALDEVERQLLERAQQAAEREVRLARRAAHLAGRAAQAAGHRMPWQGPSAHELQSEQRDPAQHEAAEAARAAEVAHLAADHLASVAEAARIEAAQAEINAGKAAANIAEVAAVIAAHRGSDPATPVGAHRNRELRRAHVAARTARALADAAAERAANLTERAHQRREDAQMLAEHAAAMAGATDAHPDSTAPTGSLTTTVVPPAPPPPRRAPVEQPTRERPRAFHSRAWFMVNGFVRNGIGWGVVLLGAEVLNSPASTIMPPHVVWALGAGAALGAAGWVMRWANRRESQRTDDLKEARKRREAWQASAELQPELLEFYLDRFRKEIQVERTKEKQEPDPWFDPKRPPSLTPTHLPPSHPWFTEYVRFMHRLERGVLEREWRPYTLLEGRLAGLASIRKQLEVVDELRAHAEQTEDRRQLDQAITDLDHLWFFYQRLVATAEPMPGPGLTPEKLAKEREKVPLDLGQPPKSPGELRPEMADALLASTGLKSGRAYHGPDRAGSLAAAQAAPSREKFYTVYVVADRDGVFIDGRHYSIREFATILRHDPAWHREPIWVTDDRTGLSEAQRKELETELGVEVVGDNTELGDLAADGHTTPAGTAFFADTDDEQLTAAREWPKRPGQHTVHIRYDLDGPYLGTRRLTEEDFRTLLEHDPNRQGQPVAIAEQTEPLAHSRRTPGGRAYYTAEETAAHAVAQAAPVREGYYTVHIRAGALGVRIGDRWLSIAEFAEAVRRDPSWQGEKLFVTDDHTGLTTAQRAELSELLGVEVDSTGTEIADLFAATAATPGGRAAYPPGWAANHEAARTAQAREDFYTLHAVFGPQGIRIGDVWLTPPEFLTFLAHDPAYRGQPIRFADAHTGLPVDLRAELSRLTGVEVRSDNADLADALAESRATPGGRALYGADELAKHQAAQHAPRKKGYYTLHVDGALDGVTIAGRWFSVDQLAAMVMQDPEWRGNALWIADEVGLSPEAMARLSELTGVRVEGSTRFAEARAAGVPVEGGLAFPPATRIPAAATPDRFPVWVTVEGDRFRIGHELFTAEEFGTLLSLDPRYAGQPVVVVPSVEPLSDDAADRLADRLGAPVTVDNRLADALADAIVLKDGLALYSPDETARLATARATPARPGHFTLHAVGTPDGIEIGGLTVPLAAVIEFVRRHPGWHGQNLWVTDPHTELTTDQRQEMAAGLGVEVHTPNGHLAEVLDASRTVPGHRAFPGTEAFEQAAALPEATSDEYVVHVVGDLDGVLIDGRRYTIDEFAEVLTHRPDWRTGQSRALRIAAEGIGLTAAARARLEQLLGLPVLTDSRLAEAWLASTPTSDGRAFSVGTDEGGMSAPPGHRVVRARAELDSVVIGPVRFTIPELAVILDQDRSARGLPLWITGGPGLTPAALRQLSDLRGAPVRGDGRFTRAMAASTAVPAGRAYFGTADTAQHMAARGFPANPRLHTVFAEGHGDQIRIGDLWFSMREWATMIRHDPAWDGRDLLVVADGVGLDMNALRELGTHLGVRVQPQAPALADLLSLGEVTPAGRSLHTDEALRAAARAVPPVPGHFVLDVVGDVDAVVVDGIRLDMRAVAALAANDPAWQGQALLVKARGLGLSQAAARELAGHLAAAGVPVRVEASAIADTLAARVGTPGGSAYYSADQAASRAAAQRAPRIPHHHVVHAIATPTGVRIGEVELTLAEFATVLRHDPAWRGQDLWFTDFLTGLSTAQCAELSALLGVAVRSDNTDVADVLAAGRVVAGNRVLGGIEPTATAEPGVYTLLAPWDLNALVVDGVRLVADRIAMLVHQDPLWDGTSPVRIAGEIGLSPETRRELANLLGVPVLGESPVADALAASSAVRDGRSLIPGRGTLVPPTDVFHTLHLIGEGNLVWIDGRAFSMAELAALIRNDPERRGRTPRLAIAGPGLDQDAVAELSRLVGAPVEVAVLGHDPGDRFHLPREGMPSDPVPMTLGMVIAVAKAYGLPLADARFELRRRSGVHGDAVTKADGTIILFPGAFEHGRAYLARVIRHELDRLRNDVPTTAHELSAQEDAVYTDDRTWWRDHPLNPEPKGPALTAAGHDVAGGPAIPFSRQSLEAVAKEYGLPLFGVTVHLSLEADAPAAAVTNHAGDIVLYRQAFDRGKGFLAFVLRQQLTNVTRLRAGEPYPATDAELTEWERHARDHARDWWDTLSHDLRPAPPDPVREPPPIPGHAVPGGRSYLPYGAQLAPPTDGAHTVHMDARDGRVEIDGVAQHAIQVANMIRNDQAWRPRMTVIIVVPHRATLDPAFVSEVGRLLNTRVTVAAPAPVLYPDLDTPPRAPIPATVDTAREVAAKYGVDLTGFELVQNNQNDAPVSFDKEGRLALHEAAFAYGEAYLARLLYQRRVYLDHVHAGNRPDDVHDLEKSLAIWRDRVERVAEWWHWHPLNPDNAANPNPRPYVPSQPGPESAYRLPVTTDGDSVIGYGDLVRLGIPELITHIRLDPRWQGRTVHLTGPGTGLAPESIAELEQGLGVPVEVTSTDADQTAAAGTSLSSAEGFLAASHTVAGGRSFLPGGSRLVSEYADVYTLHVAGDGDVILFQGRRRTMAELAAVLHLDRHWRPGMRILLAVSGRGLYEGTAEELARHTGAKVDVKHVPSQKPPYRPAESPEPRFDDESQRPPAKKVPADMATVARVADIYGIDLDLKSISIGTSKIHTRGARVDEGRLQPLAFQHGEQFLARVLFRAEAMAAMRDGGRTAEEKEAESYAREAEWWAHHPLNPDNTAPGPYLPAMPSAPFVHRVKGVGVGDRVLAYGRIPRTIPEVADHIRNDPRWDGRDVELVGLGWLSQESRDELAGLLGVRVTASDHIGQAFAAGHDVPGGRSYLDGGTQLIPGTAKARTVHVEFRGGYFIVAGREMSPAGFALVLEADPDWRGKDLLIVTQGEAIDAEVARQLARRLDVPLTVMLDEPDPTRTTYRLADTADSADSAKQPTGPLPFDMVTVRRVAARYGIDITHLPIQLKHRLAFGYSHFAGYGELILFPKAFWHGEAELARALYEGWLDRAAYRVPGRPGGYERNQAIRPEVTARLADWWRYHPLNPENLTGRVHIPSAPALPTVHRLHVRSDFDVLYVYGHIPVPITQAAESIRNDPRWRGRDVSLTSEGGLTPQHRTLLEELLGVRVTVSVAAAEVLAGSKAVQGGRSFLQYGGVLTAPQPGFHILHLHVRDGWVTAPPHELGPHELAMVIQHDPDVGNGPVILAIRGGELSEEFMNTLQSLLGTTKVTQRYVLSNVRGVEVAHTPPRPVPVEWPWLPAKDPLPRTAATLRAVAEEYGINLGATRFHVRAPLTAVGKALTLPDKTFFVNRSDGTVLLARSAFGHGEAFLARMMYEAWYRSEQQRVLGKPPRTAHEADLREAEALDAVDAWWGRHPRNPDNKSTVLFIPTAPAPPTVYRLDVRADGDGVLVYHDIRLTRAELVEYVRNDPRWRGRTVQIGGPVGFDPGLRAELEQELGDVIAPVGPLGLSGRKEVTGGISLLPGGAEAARPVEGAFTVHAGIVGDRAIVDGIPVDAAGLAALIVNDPGYDGRPVALATDDDPSPEFLDEVRRHLPVELTLATPFWAEGTDSGPHDPGSRPRDPLPVSTDTVERVAGKYGIDISGFSHRVHRMLEVPTIAATDADGTTHLLRSAFDYGEEFLAQVLHYQRTRAQQPAPTSPEEAAAQEAEARALTNQWWDEHPLNPNRRVDQPVGQIDVATPAARPSALAATAETVRETAAEYGVDLGDGFVVHDERRTAEDGTAILAETTPDGTIHFYADAFAEGPGVLARTAYRQWINAEQIRIGQQYPDGFTEQEWMAAEGDARADAWWDAHPLNPDWNSEPYLPTAPSDPDVYRIHVIGDIDGVYIYGRVRLSGDDLIELIALDPKWDGRKIVITGPVGISPELRDEIAELTGVEVEADTSAAEALAASSTVGDVTSFLPNGKRLAFPTQDAHTVHIGHRDGRFLANGAEHAPVALAAMIRHLLRGHPTPVVIATDTPVDQAVVDEIASHLGVAVTAVTGTARPGTLNRVVFPHEDDDPAEEPLPPTAEVAYEVAEEYGVPVHDTEVVVLQEQFYDEYGTAALATIDENGVLYLYPEAFAHGKAVLAVAMFHELMHIEQLRTGQPFPEAPSEPEEPAPGQPRRPAPIHDIEWMEIEAYQLEKAWWDSHPLNPDREHDELDLPTAPSPDPEFFRVLLDGDFDGGYVYGKIRLTADELIEHLMVDFRREGRPVLITGRGSLSPATKAAMEAALGVEVRVDTSAAEAFEASHTVPGGQSYLDDGAVLEAPIEDTHTVHIRYRNGQFLAGGTEHAPVAVAAMIRHHPGFGGNKVAIATDTPVDQAVLDELSRRLRVPVTTPDEARGLHYHEDTGTAPDEPLPATYDTLYDVADEYGVGLTGVPVVLADRQVGSALIDTLPNGTMIVYPKAFAHGRAVLARALNHDWIHTEQLRTGRAYPRTAGEFAAFEDEAYQIGATWWERHPLNPENRNPSPRPAPTVSDPAVYRLHDVGDIDGVLLYNRHRVSISELAQLIMSDPLWQRREVVFTGPNGLSAENQVKLAGLLGVPVTVDTSVADALEEAHAVPGGTSFLRDGRQLLLPIEDAHTVHVAVRGDRFLIDGAFFTPAAVATMIRHDPRWADGPAGRLVVIATDGEPLSAAAVAEIHEALGVPVTTAWVSTEHETPVLLDEQPHTEPVPGKALPVGMSTVRRVAAKYGIDLTGVPIGVDRWADMGGSYSGASLPSNPANPRAAKEFLDAFHHGEEALAQVLYGAWVTVEQVRTGQAIPDDTRGAEWREAEVVSRTRAWWAAHPLNPANETFGPYLPTAPAEPDVHRIDGVADFDAVILFGRVRLTMTELADVVLQDPTSAGRRLRITGPGGLTPEAAATLERLTSMAVEVDTHATEVLARSHERHGDRSFLPGGRRVAWAKPGAYTVHVTFRRGMFVLDGVEYSPAGFAVVLRHDQRWDGEELVVATDGEPVTPEVAEELGLHLNTPPVTTEFRDGADQNAVPHRLAGRQDRRDVQSAGPGAS